MTDDILSLQRLWNLLFTFFSRSLRRRPNVNGRQQYSHPGSIPVPRYKFLNFKFYHSLNFIIAQIFKSILEFHCSKFTGRIFAMEMMTWCYSKYLLFFFIHCRRNRRASVGSEILISPRYVMSPKLYTFVAF